MNKKDLTDEEIKMISSLTGFSDEEVVKFFIVMLAYDVVIKVLKDKGLIK